MLRDRFLAQLETASMIKIGFLIRESGLGSTGETCSWSENGSSRPLKEGVSVLNIMSLICLKCLGRRVEQHDPVGRNGSNLLKKESEVLVLLTLPCETVAARLGREHFTKTSVVFVGWQKNLVFVGGERRTPAVNQPTHCKECVLTEKCCTSCFLTDNLVFVLPSGSLKDRTPSAFVEEVLCTQQTFL